MRKLFLASTAMFAILTGAAFAGNTSNVSQVGIINSSSVSQQGFTTNSSTVNQLGVFNSATNNQGTSSIGNTNVFHLTQDGVQNLGTSNQVGASNSLTGSQNSFALGSIPQSNTLAAGQLGLVNGVSFTQTQH